MKPKVLFSDNHLFITVKPAGIPTQPTDLEAGWEDVCKRWLMQELNKPVIFLQTVHRLDKPVAGIVVFARSSKALKRMQEIIRLKQMKKTYTAFVEQGPLLAEDKLEHYLLHDDFRAVVVSADTNGAKLAQLKYKIVEQLPDAIKLEIDLITGRYHQIRAQFSAIGYPILGDQKYGSKRISTNQIALYHTAVSFVHPVTKEDMHFVIEDLNLL